MKKIFFPRFDDFVTEKEVVLKHGLQKIRKYYNDVKQTLLKYRTDNINDADYLFIPINLIEFQFAGEEERLADYLKCNYSNYNINKVICAFGDFGQRKRSKYESVSVNRIYKKPYKFLEDINLIAFESTADLYDRDITLIPWIKRSRIDLTSIIQINNLFKQKRDLIYSFVGETSYFPNLPENHIRGLKLKSLEGNDTSYFIGKPSVCESLYGKYGGFKKMLYRSIFTLCPAGYGRWTYRLAESLAAGSIPVIISDGYILPHQNQIKWDNICLRVSEDNICNLKEIIMSKKEEEIQSMQYEISCAKKHLTLEAQINNYLN